MAAHSIRNAARRHGILVHLSGLFQWLQFVDDATLVFEGSGVTISMAGAEADNMTRGEARGRTTVVNLGFVDTKKGCSMGIREELLGKTFSLSDSFLEQRDTSLLLTSVIAERKAFLSKKVLTYRCRIRINDGEKKVYLFEILDERGSGMTMGSGDDETFSTPGFGFKVEKYNTKNGTRRGTIEEESVLFGKEYTYRFNWNEVKDFALETANKFGYQMEIVLDERSLQKKQQVWKNETKE